MPGISHHVIVLVAAAALLHGCSGNDVKPGEAKELVENKSAAAEGPEAQLLENGKRLYADGLYTVARDTFESLRSTYPLSPYVEFAEIKIADTYFEGGEYADAAIHFEEFSKNHPSAEAFDYALLMAGRSQQLQNRGVGRDAAPLNKALEFYNRLLSERPASAYVADAKKFKHQVEKKLAEHDLFVIDFYKRRNRPEAARVREENYRARWAGILDQPVPQKKEGEALSSFASVTLPQSDLPAPKLVALKAQADTASRYMVLAAPAIVNIPGGGGSSALGVPDLVQNVECRRGDEGQIYLYLNNPVEDKEFFVKNRELHPQQGAIKVDLPGEMSREIRQDCLAISDLKIDTAGRLTIRSESSAKLLELNNPPRILVLVAAEPSNALN